MPNIVEPTPEDIKRFRSLMGLSQSALGEAIGSSARTVEDWEAGRRKAPAMLHLAMAAIAARLLPSIDAIEAYKTNIDSLAASIAVMNAFNSVDISKQSDDERYYWSLDIKKSIDQVNLYWQKLNNNAAGGFVEGPRFEVYRDKSGEHRVKYLVGRHAIASTEGYSDASGAKRAIESIKKFSPDAPAFDTSRADNSTTTGHKFEVYQDKSGLYRVRFKYNSEIIFTTEAYTTKGAAISMVSHLKNNMESAPVKS